MPKPLDRWHELDRAIDASNLTASDKAVYHQFLKHSDYVTADLPAKRTPTREKIGRLASLSQRQVAYAVSHLELHDWLKRSGRTGPRKSPSYSLQAGEQCHCTGRVHVRTGATEPAAVAPDRVQPTGATPQVKGQFLPRGIEREEEEDAVQDHRSLNCPACGWPVDSIGCEANCGVGPNVGPNSRRFP